MSEPTIVSPERLGEALDVALHSGPDAAAMARVRDRVLAPRRKSPRLWLFGAAVALTLGGTAAVFMLRVAAPPSLPEAVPTQTIRVPLLPSTGSGAPKIQPPPVTRKQLSLSFEPGIAALMQVSVATDSCPPRRGNHGCLRGERGQEREIFAQIVGVRMVDRTRGLWSHSPGARLAFDVWVGEATGKRDSVLSLWLNNATQKMAYFLLVNNVVPGRWHHIDVALDDFSPETPQAMDHVAAGDRMDFLLIATRYQTEDVLFVDNVDLWMR